MLSIVIALVVIAVTMISAIVFCLGHRLRETGAQRDRWKKAHGDALDMIRQVAADQKAQRDAPSSPMRGAINAKRVIVTDITDKTAWQGVLGATYDDCVVLQHANELKKGPDGRMVSTSAPGDVVIPAHRIMVIQVVAGDDE